MNKRAIEKGEFEEHGISCPVCFTELHDGDIITEVFDGIAPPMLGDEDFTEVVILVCDSCGDLENLYEELEHLK